MAEVEEQPQPAIAASIQSMPGVRLVVLLLGLAGAVAVGAAVALWSQSPTYRVLFPSMDQSEIGAVASVLDTAGIDYQLDPASGSLVVAADKVNDAQMLLAGQGLPRSKGVSLENLYEGSGYSTSQFMESKFYAHALENKLRQDHRQLEYGQSGPSFPGFARNRRYLFVIARSRARRCWSTFILGRALEPGQVKAIIHLVASSVPDLNASNVTLLDQNSTLLSDVSTTEGLGEATSQFEYRRRIENALAENIDGLLVPIMGIGRSRTKVVAQMDFTELEETTERFDPASQVVRSEQTKEQKTTGGLSAVGIPGALSNQPPAAAAGNPDSEPEESLKNSVSDVILNYEVDRTVSRKRAPQGRLERLSVAVVLDYLPETGGGRNAVPVPLTAAKLDEIRGLIKEAVGYDEARGDTLNLMNEPFQSSPGPTMADPPPWWEQAWVLDVGKLLVAVFVVLALVLWVLRPLVQGLVQTHRAQLSALASPALELGQDYAQGRLMPREDPMQIAQGLASSDPQAHRPSGQAMGRF